ncbi:MAG: hypothetical protein HYW26_04795 [Candidatus Aenigmarchaeota archaeon]|nr:hypothetical protein [Candidatus Aenigmarchaeota archaeon]
MQFRANHSQKGYPSKKGAARMTLASHAKKLHNIALYRPSGKEDIREAAALRDLIKQYGGFVRYVGDLRYHKPKLRSLAEIGISIGRSQHYFAGLSRAGVYPLTEDICKIADSLGMSMRDFSEGYRSACCKKTA